MPYRLIYAGLGLLVLAAVALGVAFGGGGEPTELPTPIESVNPLPGDQVLQQAFIEIDMAVGYEAAIFVDGFRLPDNEVNFVEGTVVYRWAPSPASTYLTSWTPGPHTVRIEYDTVAGVPDPGVFEYEFRVS